MRNRFDRQLDTLNLELIRMGAQCEDAIEAAMEVLLYGRQERLEKVLQLNNDINHSEKDIEALCMKILLQQQPVAHDLRDVSSALKMIYDMERIGDQAADIADICRFVTQNQQEEFLLLNDLADTVSYMVTKSIDSFVKKDLELAQHVIAYDDKADDLFSQIRTGIIQQVSAGEKDGEYAVDLLMIAKYLERIGDHAVNIAGWVVYSITGTHEI